MSTIGFQLVACCAPTHQADARAYDRAWLVVNDSGLWLSQTLCSRLATVSVALRFGYLVLSALGIMRLDIPLNVIEDDDSVRHTMLVGEQQLDVIDEGELAAAWISNVVKVPCRIVKIHPDTPIWIGQNKPA